MTDKPMIFSAPMVRALMLGNKTQTRRRLKEQNSIADAVKIGGRYQWKSWKTGCILGDVALPYAPGNRLWVREAHTLTTDCKSVVYRVDATDMHGWRWETITPGDPRGEVKWRPSIHMPRWASRLTLVVTDVRVQRISEITLGECWAEGCETARDLIDAHVIPKGAQLPFKEFRDLWNSLHGPDAWARNDWVVCLSFETHRKNIDEMGAQHVSAD